VDGVATVASGEDDSALYGGSSTIAFVRHVTHGIDSGSSTTTMPGLSQGHRRSGAGSRRSLPSPAVIRDKDETAAVYPDRRRTDEYVQCYWEFMHPLFPILHRPSFMASYEEVWLPENTARDLSISSEVERTVFSCTLNLILALGCQFSTSIPSAKKQPLADEFYERSRRLFIYEILDSSSVSLVQLLLLQGVYLQSSRYASRCWNVVGLAIRVAQSLGLHVPVERQGETQLIREMRRRIWHTCVVLDR